MIDLTKYIAISPDISDTWEKDNEINSIKYKEGMGGWFQIIYRIYRLYRMLKLHLFKRE